MKVVWSKQAAFALRDTTTYIRKEFGQAAKQKFLNEVHYINDLLSTTPELGAIELLLIDLPINYRSVVVNRLNKIVYYQNDDTIEVVAFWDTRREPSYLVRAIEK